MTITIPNYFLENKSANILTLAKGLYVEFNPTATDKHLVRNTMHGMLLVRRGSKEIELENESFTLRVSEIMLFAQGNYFTSQNSSDYVGIVVFFDDQFILGMIRKYGITLSGSKVQSLVVKKTEKRAVEYLAMMIENDIKEKGPHQKVLLGLKVETLILEILEANCFHTKAFLNHIQHSSLQRMRYILEQNLDIIESVEDMYKLMRMGPTAFGKRFVKEFGTSPKKWLDQQRMKKASLLLVSSTKPIVQIATDCGYATVSWFIVQFKKHYKMTPKEYRVKNQHQ